jgi:hypothetical protein
MPFQTNYMGTTDAAQVTWLRTFVDALSASPATYFVDPAAAVTLDGLVTTVEASFATGGTTGRFANNPATYTPVTAALFAADLSAAKATAAPQAQQIRQNLGIDDADKIAAGVRPLNNSRIPIPVPVSIPILNVLFAAPGTHTLEFADSATPASKTKPFGAIHLQLFVNIGVAAVMDPLLADYLLSATRNPVFAGFLAGDNGKIATYFARWVTRKGGTGDWSAPVAMTIAF